ncbi:hypothetical protein SEA_MORGANA_106 [Gordonia phage Morgana]|uniref:Minor tail protein n=1 Tax=Gordonia phage Morgana TaxID=3137292 RepID=A0AAX4RAV5_9CAUD
MSEMPFVALSASVLDELYLDWKSIAARAFADMHCGPASPADLLVFQIPEATAEQFAPGTLMVVRSEDRELWIGPDGIHPQAQELRT